MPADFLKNHMGMSYIFEKCIKRASECNLSWSLTHRYGYIPGRTKKTFGFQRPNLAVVLAACAGNQQRCRGYFSNML